MVTRQEFHRQISAIATVDEEWLINTSDSGNILYLRRSGWKKCNGQLFRIVYDLAYHLNYQSPVLCLTIQDERGKQIDDIDRLWSIFESDIGHCDNKLNAITQMEHPVHFNPVWMIHPCQTPHLLRELQDSHNLILSFITTICPFVGLHLDIKTYKDILQN